MPKAESLVTKEFVALNAIIFLAFCNIAVFFQFHQYLGDLGISPDYFGALIGLFSVSVLAIRPIISPWIHRDNAKRWILISCGGVIISLFLYNAANDFWSMALVRLVHGAAYVVLATAALNRMVEAIPANKSAQAFGLISVVTLLPYAVIPPFLGPLISWAGAFDRVLDLSALAMFLAFPLLFFVENKPLEQTDFRDNSIGLSELKENLADPRVIVLLLLSLLVWTSFTPVFYFLNGYAEKLGIENAGWFFTISTLMEITVRIVAGHLFDRVNKWLLLLAAIAWLGAGNFALAAYPGAGTFYCMSVWLGIGWGVTMPVLSGLVFDVSKPKLRAFNTNLAMEMFQAGFFVGPVLGGAILVAWGYSALYYACAGILWAGLVTGAAVSRARRQGT